MLPNESEGSHPTDDPDATFSAFKVPEATDGHDLPLCRERD